MIRKTEGFALLDLLFVCGILGVLSAVALPRMLLAKQVAGAASAIGSMRAINSGELTYALTCGAGFYAPKLTTLGTAPPGSKEPFVAGGLGDADTVTKSGYVIKLSAVPFDGAPATCNGLGAGDASRGFTATADPSEPTNARFFGTNANGYIYEDSTSLLGVMPEVGEPASGHPLR